MESRGVPRISAVVWDLDDTLADTLPARVAALTRVFRDVNIEHTDPAHLLLNLEGKTLEESLLLLAVSLGRPADCLTGSRASIGRRPPVRCGCTPAWIQCWESLNDAAFPWRL